MRIIAGKYKGKVLKEFELSSTRPTADIVRGAIFNILGTKIIDSVFLDLFAGTGAVGIEAISRGCKTAYFVDQNKQSINLIKNNLKAINQSECSVINESFEFALKNFSNQNVKFDIIFLDPPYKTDYAEDVIFQIQSLNVLNKNAIIVWEHDETKLDKLKEFSNIVKTKKYGKKYVTILAF